MPRDNLNHTIEKTEWTNSLLEDLYASLRNKRDDATVRAFARELMDDKDLPLSYLVNKVRSSVGSAEAERLDLLIRGRRAVEKAKAEQAKSKGGVLGLMRKFLR